MERETKTGRRRRCRVLDEARVRAPRACISCRRLKEKCDGNQPCSRCLRTTRNCEFSATGLPPSSKRGVGEEAERVRHLERIVVHYLGPVPLDLDNLRGIIDRIDDDLTLDPSLENEFDVLALEEEDCPVKPISQSTAHYSGEFSHWQFSQHVRRRVGKHLNGTRDILEQSGDPTSNVDRFNETFDVQGNMRILEYWRATQLQSTGSHVLNTLECLPPRGVAEFLSQIYFQFAQTSIFFVEASWLQEKLDILYERPAHLSSPDSGWVCTVVMVLAVGVQFTHMAEGPCTETQEEGSQQGVDVSLAFYKMATTLIPDIITLASMESVQACLLLAHYALPLDAHGLAYTYLGLAMKLAIQNGMHRKYTGLDLDDWTLEMRNRLWWTTYALERRISVLHGRPTSIISTEMDADRPKDVTAFQQHEHPPSIQNASVLIDMTIHLSDISHAISSLRCPKSLQPVHFRKTLEKYQKLQKWWLKIPEPVRKPSITSYLDRPNAHLKLSFHIIEIFVGRPFVFYNATHISPQPSPTPEGQLPPSVRATSRMSLVEAAVTAAFEIIELLRIMNNKIGLARASYTEFSACRAALLLLLAQSLNEQTERLRSVIALGMRLIRNMAAGNILSARSETSVIEVLEEAVRRLHTRENPRTYETCGASEKSTEQEQSGYARFKDWASLWTDVDTDTSVHFPGNDTAISSQMPLTSDGVSWQPPDTIGWFAEDFNLDSFNAFDFDSMMPLDFLQESSAVQTSE
ncbi:hypothetical protein K458DRAFT_312672 [Lentithecium fluviatile CBS 122367]|uniref:Zn(2)-C6 fungal-type domain-containing protein n=1 Tax=Lentithecium fluviatile CBS 122367 TaxID=1168545 RepID=A0A6G1IPL1_9PLEO|nr:hypothetical protein K458DRAFT_312672 [Lentithecium fluviatile CBS 122367]